MEIKEYNGLILFKRNPRRFSVGVYINEEGMYDHGIPFHFQSGDNPIGLKGPLRERPYFMFFTDKSIEAKSMLEKILEIANSKKLEMEDVRIMLESRIPGALTFNEYNEEFLEVYSEIDESKDEMRKIRRILNGEKN